MRQRQTEELAISDIGTIRQINEGIFASLFSFGTIELDGKGGEPLSLRNLRHPTEIKNLIWKLKESGYANQTRPIV